MDTALEYIRQLPASTDWEDLVGILQAYNEHPTAFQACGKLIAAGHEQAVERMASDLSLNSGFGQVAYVSDPADRWQLFQTVNEAVHSLDGRSLDSTALAVFLVAPLAEPREFVASTSDDVTISLVRIQIDTVQGLEAFLARGLSSGSSYSQSTSASAALIVSGQAGTTMAKTSSPLKRTVTAANLDEPDKGGVSASTSSPTKKARTSASLATDLTTPPMPPVMVSDAVLPAAGSPPIYRRKKDAVRLTKLRDNNRCIFTGIMNPEAAHVFPLSATKPEGLSCIRRLLSFWGAEKCEKWLSRCRERGVTESPRNMLSMSASMQDWWRQGRFALKPLPSKDPNELLVQFYWTPRSSWKQKADVPSNYEDAVLRGACGGSTEAWGEGEIAHRPSGLRIASGQVFSICAENPDHLPDWELLELHWDLIRVAAMSGAADDIPNYSFDDDSTTDGEAELDEKHTVAEWLSDAVP